MAVTAAHFQLQYLDGFFSLKAEREKVFLGSRRGGGEYTVPEVRGYPGEELLKRGVVPDDVLNKKCLKRRNTGGHASRTKRWRKCSLVNAGVEIRGRGRKKKKLCLHCEKVNIGADTPIYHLTKVQMTGSHMCKLLSNFSFRWTLPDIWAWTDCVSNSFRSSQRSLFNVHLFYSLFFFSSLAFTPHMMCLVSTLGFTAAPLFCPHCPSGVGAQREDNKGIWTIILLLILPIILCHHCTCSPIALPLPLSPIDLAKIFFLSHRCYSTHVFWSDF